MEHKDKLLESVIDIIATPGPFFLTVPEQVLLDQWIATQVIAGIRNMFNNQDLDFNEVSARIVCDNTTALMRRIHFNLNTVEALFLNAFLCQCINKRTGSKFVRKPSSNVLPIFGKRLNAKEKRALQIQIENGEINEQEIIITTYGHYNEEDLPTENELCSGYANVPVESVAYWIYTACTSMSVTTPSLAKYYSQYTRSILAQSNNPKIDG